MTVLAFSGSDVDGGLYLRITRLASHTPTVLNDVVSYWTDFGLGVFAVLMVAAWWQAREHDSARMARALAAPLIVVLVYAADMVLKSAVHERRPCQTLPGAYTVEACPGTGDWSFPSNHAVIAASAAVVIWLLNRALGVVAAVAALAMAASRVWVGVHYPHDVVAGVLLGVLLAVPLMLAAGRAAPWVERLRTSPLRPVVARR
ncbi:phosphatase PAP2 family protein [Yinghuangia seranimata]|uniref:phosphatase PAP2 family protein n=1 Tax=Yinghuangia seranimata TaxID=408067 RepID=UPI00248C548E|nr:phosphatase PAP2 family protein [Yinghuangia seranimata]MDI2130095.1 phosphatase PAP2 family protein [Yinghuangia seranimata]